MKKTVLLFIFFVAANVAFAQLHFGPKVGYNTSKLSIDKADINTDLKNSFQFGAFVRLGTKVYIQPEVNFLTQGGIFERPELGSLSPFKQEVSLKTIQIPVMIGAKLAAVRESPAEIFYVGGVAYYTQPTATARGDFEDTPAEPTPTDLPIPEIDINIVYFFNP